MLRGNSKTIPLASNVDKQNQAQSTGKSHHGFRRGAACGCTRQGTGSKLSVKLKIARQVGVGVEWAEVKGCRPRKEVGTGAEGPHQADTLAVVQDLPGYGAARASRSVQRERNRFVVGSCPGAAGGVEIDLGQVEGEKVGPDRSGGSCIGDKGGNGNRAPADFRVRRAVRAGDIEN